jgi:uncharacterized protein (PEP-CTERM system associated)
VQAAIFVEESYTSNVDLQAASGKRGDFITQIAPSVRFSGQGARTSADAAISLPIFLYARTGSENNRIVPNVNVSGNADLYEKRVFIDASANISQQYFSPFGPRSVSLANQTDNEYRQETYRISPYIRGETFNDVRYEVRDDNSWSRLGSTPVAASNSYTNDLVADVARRPAPFGWSLNYRRTEVEFQDQNTQLSQIGRARFYYAPNPQAQLFVTGGYEDNRFPLSHTSNTIYGVGINSRLSERTRLAADWEHRFFGSAYHFTFDHRRPLSVWTVTASRDITTSPQLVAQFPAGGSISTLLNSLFSTRVTDPAVRDQFVQQFIRDRGLPETLASPFNIYSEQILLDERASATVGLIGSRNGVFVSYYHARTEQITGRGTGFPPGFELAANSTQDGASVSWSHSLTPFTTLAFNSDYGTARSHGDVGVRSTHGAARLNWTSRLSPYTSVFAGTRYQQFHSDVADDWNEFAIFAGFTYIFH